MINFYADNTELWDGSLLIHREYHFCHSLVYRRTALFLFFDTCIIERLDILQTPLQKRCHHSNEGVNPLYEHFWAQNRLLFGVISLINVQLFHSHLRHRCESSVILLLSVISVQVHRQCRHVRHYSKMRQYDSWEIYLLRLVVWCILQSPRELWIGVRVRDRGDTGDCRMKKLAW